MKTVSVVPTINDYSGGGGHTSATSHIEGAKDLTKFLKIKGLV